MFCFLDRAARGSYNEAMKTITKEFSCPYLSDLEALGPVESILFFDIETTGLSSAKDQVYLIGCACVRDGRLLLKQWFADSPAAEAELLVHFYLFASRFSLLVHFNGDAFDLPFLRERAARFSTPLPRAFPKSLDLYKRLRPLKKLLCLPDCRQKTLEAVLCTDRKDVYDGGQLIRFYGEYLRTGKEEPLHALLLHNEEDVRGLSALPRLLAYGRFLEGPLAFLSARLREYREPDGSVQKEAILSFKGNQSLPAPCSFGAGGVRVLLREDTLTLRLPLREGTLLYFFKNPADYYYLPEEGRAIHKSVAAYVDKAHKKKATAATCFQPREGIFFPVPRGLETGLPLFSEGYKKKPFCLEYREELFHDPGFLHDFLLAVLSE